MRAPASFAIAALAAAGSACAPTVRAALRMPRDERSAVVQRLERAEWIALVRVESAQALGFARARAEVSLEKALRGSALPPRFTIVHRTSASQPAAEPGASYLVFLRDPSVQPLGGDAAPEEGAYRAVGTDIGPRLRGAVLESGDPLARVEDWVAEDNARAQRFSVEMQDLLEGRRDIGLLRLRLRARDREGGHTVVSVGGSGEVEAEAFDARNTPHQIATAQLSAERVYDALKAGGEALWFLLPLTSAEPGPSWYEVQLDLGTGGGRRKLLPPEEAVRLGDLWAVFQEAARRSGAPNFGEPWRPGEDRNVR
jgi:hypothetical protein